MSQLSVPVSQSISQFVQELVVVQNESSQSQSQLRKETPAPALALTFTPNVQNAPALTHTSTQNVENVQDYSCLDPTSSSMQDLMNLIKDQSNIVYSKDLSLLYLHCKSRIGASVFCFIFQVHEFQVWRVLRPLEVVGRGGV